MATRILYRSKTQVQGVRTNENMYNILTSQLCRARQFNRHTAARGGRMYNWFAAQQSLVEKVADEPGDGPQAVLSSSVFRPICSKEPQLLLVKDIQGGIMRFEVMVCFSVFRGAVAREPGASRRLRVTKNLGINAPAEAVARILVLYLEWVPPNKETCTVQRVPVFSYVSNKVTTNFLRHWNPACRQGVLICARPDTHQLKGNTCFMPVSTNVTYFFSGDPIIVNLLSCTDLVIVSLLFVVVFQEDLGEMKQRGFYVTSTMARSKLVTPLDEVLGEIPIEEWGTRNGCCYFALPEKTMEFLREVEEGEINPMTFFLPKKKENEKQVVSTSEKQDCGFSVMDFPRGATGQRNLKNFSKCCPMFTKSRALICFVQAMLSRSTRSYMHGDLCAFNAPCILTCWRRPRKRDTPKLFTTGLKDSFRES